MTPSPFPGMDPYLERHWSDVHARLIVYASDQLQSQLGGPLRARVEERLIVEVPGLDDRNIYPDARVFEAKPSGRRGAALAVMVTPAEPLVIEVPEERRTETYIEVLDRSAGERLVTVVELMWPSNKSRGPGRRAYRRKQRECVDAGVSLVEVDLTRAGRRAFTLEWDRVPAAYRTAYGACVYRPGEIRSRYELYAMPLRSRLPAIGVPLRPQDAAATLDLQPLLAQAYRNGAYDDLDYAVPPVPPLSADDAAWAATLARPPAAA